MKAQTLVVKIEKNKCYVSGGFSKFDNAPYTGRLYSKVWHKDLGVFILNVLLGTNREAGAPIQVLVNGVDETAQFKKDVVRAHKNIKNTAARDGYYFVCGIC